MKIDNTIKNIASVTANENRPAKTGDKTAGGAAADSVIVSDMTAKLKPGDARLANVPDIDYARVAEIKQAIASGSIAIRPENIADGLLDSVVKMLGSEK